VNAYEKKMESKNHQTRKIICFIINSKSKIKTMRLKCKMLKLKVFTLVLLLGLGISSQISAQQRSIEGTVTDNQGSPLPGVTVVVKGTTQGGVTNADGNYSITNIPENATLVFSFVGMKTHEVVVGNQTSINVTMEQETIGLEEVVAVGYGTMKKSDLTGSVSSIGTDQLNTRTISSVEEGLQGTMAGVHVNQATGQPGGKTIIRIRGQNSILGSSDPLYVLDGVPIQSGTDGNTSLLANINPADIETVDVLKDASSTAIYGARGSNGVILITTKQGSTGQQRINFESTIGISNVIKKIDLLDSEQFVEIANEQAFNDNFSLPFPDVTAVLKSGINTDWQDEIFQTALTQNYSLSYSGGDEKSQYFASGNYFDQEGIIVGSGFSRGSFRLNLDQQVSNRLKFSSYLTASQTRANRGNTDATSGGVLRDALGAPPFLPPRDENGEFTPGAELYGYSFSESAGDNPLITAYEQMNELTINRFVGNVKTQYDFIDKFSMEVMLGTDYSSRTLNTYESRLLRDVTDGSGSEERTETFYYIIENLYKYNESFVDGTHHLDIVGGFTWESSKSNFLSGSAEGFITDDFLNRNLGAGERFSAPNNGLTEWDLISFLGRINYSFLDRYLITMSARRDGSSRFGEGNKWAFFPSFALAWRIAEESFMEQIDQISDLKLRFSWGKSGNEAITPYQSLQRFTPQPMVTGGSRKIGFAPANLGNPNLKWETTEQMDIGLDFGMWDQRVRMNLDFYKKTTSDLLAMVVLPPTSGFSSVIQNIGVIENKGIEVNFGIDIFRDKHDFGWDVNFNLSSNRNVVKKLDKGADVITSGGYTGESILREGEPVSAFYGIKEDGLTNDGLIKYVDQNSDGDINNDDRVIIGNPHPDFVFGFNSQIDYKNFYLSAFLQGEYGKDIQNHNLYWHGLPFFRGNNVITAVEDRWTPENPNPNAAWPKATMNLNFYKSDRYIEDGTYIRLKNVRFGYNVPIKRLPFRSLSFFVSAENLFTITKYSWYNPDINTYQSDDIRLGYDLNTYPVAKTVTLGINIGL
jgi:TonB-dependent starch-binding outer membrane protein SusC